MVEGQVDSTASGSIGRGGMGSVNITERGIFQFVVRGPDGEIKQTAEAENGLTTQGASRILNKWKAASGDTSLYVGLIKDGGSAPTLVAGDTALSHTGWVEVVSTDGGGSWTATREPWAPADTSDGTLTAAADTWTFGGASSTIVLRGAFVTNDNTSGSTGGELIATSVFTGGGTIAVSSTDSLTITFTITLA